MTQKYASVQAVVVETTTKVRLSTDVVYFPNSLAVLIMIQTPGNLKRFTSVPQNCGFTTILALHFYYNIVERRNTDRFEANEKIRGASVGKEVCGKKVNVDVSNGKILLGSRNVLLGENLTCKNVDCWTRWDEVGL